ncbi:hypothetical protein, partial [Mycolicibacter algericus]|uniref:hypothetical protein n=1 Tax=Mycolicibacter algericus TaxID=1288388 RepID=UPI0021F25E38
MTESIDSHVGSKRWARPVSPQPSRQRIGLPFLGGIRHTSVVEDEIAQGCVAVTFVDHARGGGRLNVGRHDAQFE